jgi:hypothetical protein
VDTPPPEDEHPTGPFAPVFRTADASLLPLVKSLLESAEIPFLVQGEETTLGLLPLGPVGGGSDRRLLGAVVKVPQEHEETARGLLAGLTQVPEEEE